MYIDFQCLQLPLNHLVNIKETFLALNQVILDTYCIMCAFAQIFSVDIISL